MRTPRVHFPAKIGQIRRLTKRLRKLFRNARAAPCKAWRRPVAGKPVPRCQRAGNLSPPSGESGASRPAAKSPQVPEKCPESHHERLKTGGALPVLQKNGIFAAQIGDIRFPEGRLHYLGNSACATRRAESNGTALLPLHHLFIICVPSCRITGNKPARPAERKVIYAGHILRLLDTRPQQSRLRAAPCRLARHPLRKAPPPACPALRRTPAGRTNSARASPGMTNLCVTLKYNKHEKKLFLDDGLAAAYGHRLHSLQR